MRGFVSASALDQELREGRAVTLIEARWAQGVLPEDRLPDAAFVDTDSLEDGWPTWRLRSVDELSSFLGSLGISEDRPAVVTGTSAIAAARVGWVLAWLGVREVRLLDGGSVAWRPFARPAFSSEPARFRPRLQPSVVATAAQIEQGGLQVGDVRSLDEFRGEVSGYSYLQARGRIPAAVWLGDADDSGELFRPDGRFADSGRVVERWVGRGLDANRPAVFTCGGGWRAALAWFFASAAGLPGPRCHPGGWGEWAARYDVDGQEFPSGRAIAVG